MNVNIYYGGRGMIDDPSLFVVNKINEVLLELKVKVKRYDLHDMKNSITTLPQTLKDVDAVVLATTVEWYGIGSYMQEFLDDCWLYGDKDKIKNIYMFPIVMSKTYGEKEALMTLSNSWDILGGSSMNGISAYVNEDAGFEFNDKYIALIERYAENIYRTISQNVATFPSSSAAIKGSLLKETLQLTPQESEQLSKFVSDDNFVAKQKRDIEELSGMFKEMLGDQERGGDDYYVSSLKNKFSGKPGNKLEFQINISDKKKNILVNIDGVNINIELMPATSADIVLTLTQNVFDDIIYGRMTFQHAFMSGAMKAKGSLSNIRMLDEIFNKEGR